MNKPLTLTCNYAFAPGYDWSAELVFKPLKRGGFAVTGQLAEDDENGVRRIVGKSTEPFTWRSACRWLQENEEAGLAGDVLSSIEHDAEIAWQGELVAWSWIAYDQPEDGLFALLSNADDDVLARLWSVHQSLVGGVPWQELSGFAAAVSELDWLDLSLSDILERLGIARAAVTPELLRRAAEAELAKTEGASCV